ncbi:MAG: SDR family NAD(P)-dependent oxidoreductase, partial [Alphaproteobacteria bacterium]
MGTLTGDVAIITGAQQGVGRAIARAMAQQGANIVVNYLDDGDSANAVVVAARAQGVVAVAVQADISKPEEVALLMRAADDLGGVSILVNNAAVFPRAPFLDMAESEWDFVLGVNLKGSFLCAQAAAKR